MKGSHGVFSAGGEVVVLDVTAGAGAGITSLSCL